MILKGIPSKNSGLMTDGSSTFDGDFSRGRCLDPKCGTLIDGPAGLFLADMRF